MEIRPMTISDYEQVFAMWQITSKRALSQRDTKENIEKYLNRNPKMSMIALDGDKVVGAVLAGHDGRRGFIYHIAVLPEYRRHKIGRSLVERAVKSISADGITKMQIFCYEDNLLGQSFWKSMGFDSTDNILFEKEIR